MTNVYEFGPFRLDTSEGLLLRDGTPVPLMPKSFDMLRVLVENRGRLLQKDELMRLVWPDSFVEEGNLSHHVFSLRKALGDDKGPAGTSKRFQSADTASSQRSVRWGGHLTRAR